MPPSFAAFEPSPRAGLGLHVQRRPGLMHRNKSTCGIAAPRLKGALIYSPDLPHRARCARTNSHAQSIGPNQADEFLSPSTFLRAQGRQWYSRIVPCRPMVRAKIQLSCAAHPRRSKRAEHFVWQAIEWRSERAVHRVRAAVKALEATAHQQRLAHSRGREAQTFEA